MLAEDKGGCTGSGGGGKRAKGHFGAEMISRGDPDSLVLLKSERAVQLACVAGHTPASCGVGCRGRCCSCVHGHVNTLVVKGPCTHQPEGS